MARTGDELWEAHAGKKRRAEDEPEDESASDSEGSGRGGASRGKPRTRVRGFFTPEKDARLVELQAQHQNDWTAISAEFAPGANAKQCRDRFNNYARPDLNHGPCQPHEVLVCIALHKLHGSKWTEIANGLSANNAEGAMAGAKTRRAENFVKNLFNSKQRKKTKEESSVVFAPLFAYLAEREAAGQALSSKQQRKGEAQQRSAAQDEAEATATAQRRTSARVTKRPCYNDFVESVEDEEDETEDETQEQEAPPLPTFDELMAVPDVVPAPLLPTAWYTNDFGEGLLPAVPDALAGDDEMLAAFGIGNPDSLDINRMWADMQADNGDVALLWPPAPPAAPTAQAAPDSGTVSRNVQSRAAPCPSVARSARSDGAAVSAAARACLTPSSREAADPRDLVDVRCEPLTMEAVQAAIMACEKRHLGSFSWNGTTLNSERGISEDAAAMARTYLEALSADVHRRWQSVQCAVLLLRAGELNGQELAGSVHVGGTNRDEASAAVSYAVSQMNAMLKC